MCVLPVLETARKYRHLAKHLHPHIRMVACTKKIDKHAHACNAHIIPLSNMVLSALTEHTLQVHTTAKVH